MKPFCKGKHHMLDSPSCYIEFEWNGERFEDIPD